MTQTEVRGGDDAAKPPTPAKGAGGVVVDHVPADPPPTVVRLVKRIPFTSTYVLITMVLSVVFGTLWGGIEQKSVYEHVAYGLPAFEGERWYTLVSGNFFALYPVYYLFVAGLFLLLTGFAEWKLGTLRTVVLCVVYQVAAVLVVALIFLIFRDSGWEWAQQRATETDVGFSAGMMGAICVATATVRPPWRLRMRLLIWAYVSSRSCTSGRWPTPNTWSPSS